VAIEHVRAHVGERPSEGDRRQRHARYRGEQRDQRGFGGAVCVDELGCTLREEGIGEAAVEHFAGDDHQAQRRAIAQAVAIEHGCEERGHHAEDGDVVAADVLGSTRDVG
jgi:hypothetical protein